MSGLEQAAVRGRQPGRAGQRRAEHLGQQPHGRGGPHRVAVPPAADHRGFRRQEVRLVQRAGADLLAEPPHVGPAPQRDAPEGPCQHRAAGHDNGRQVHRGRRHEQRRDRLVTAAEQHCAIDRVRAQHLLGGHGRHVAPQHRGRPHIGLTQGDDRKVQRDATRLVDPVPDGGGDLVQVRVARGEIGRGVRDRDVRPPREGVRRQAPPHPGPMEVRIAVVARVPLCAPKFSHTPMRTSTR